MDYAGIRPDRANPAALYQQVGEALAAAIGRGELRVGERLPSERALARRLAVSRTTAVAAYRDLAARGLVRGQVGRGTYVCATPPVGGSEQAGREGPPFAWRGKVALGALRALDPSLRGLVRAGSDPGLISFAAGASAPECFPTEAFGEALERALGRDPAAALGFGPTEGLPRLRRAIAARLGTRPERVLVVAGAQQGLDLIARCLIDPGDAVVLDRPGYLGAIQAFRAAGAHLVGWDAVRADLDELDDLLLRYRPKLLYTGPTHHNPTGRTLDRRTRRGLLDLAARHRLPVVEDDPYRELGFPDAPSPPPALAEPERGLVIGLGTFAKSLAGGLRLGWVAADEAIVDHLGRIRGGSDVCSQGLTQLAVADLIASGRLDAHLAALRAEHARRHAAMRDALARHLPPGALDCAPVRGGLYLWGRLADGRASGPLLRAARAAGVAFAPGAPFFPDGAGQGWLRLCFSSVPPPAIEEGARRLAAALAAEGARPGSGDRRFTPT